MNVFSRLQQAGIENPTVTSDKSHQCHHCHQRPQCHHCHQYVPDVTNQSPRPPETPSQRGVRHAAPPPLRVSPGSYQGVPTMYQYSGYNVLGVLNKHQHQHQHQREHQHQW